MSMLVNGARATIGRRGSYMNGQELNASWNFSVGPDSVENSTVAASQPGDTFNPFDGTTVLQNTTSNFANLSASPPLVKNVSNYTYTAKGFEVMETGYEAHDAKFIQQINAYLSAAYVPTLDGLAVAGIVFALVFTVYGSRLKNLGLFVQGGMAGAIAAQFIIVQIDQDIPDSVGLLIDLVVALLCGIFLLCSIRASKSVVALSFGLVIAYSLRNSLQGLIRVELYYIALCAIVLLCFWAAFKVFAFTVAASSSATAGLCFVMGVNRFIFEKTGLSVNDTLEDSSKLACQNTACWALIAAGLFLAIVGTVIQWRNLCDARHEVAPPTDHGTKPIVRRTKDSPEYVQII